MVRPLGDCNVIDNGAGMSLEVLAERYGSAYRSLTAHTNRMGTLAEELNSIVTSEILLLLLIIILGLLLILLLILSVFSRFPKQQDLPGKKNKTAASWQP